jgi:DNA mismatch repair protein MutL
MPADGTIRILSPELQNQIAAGEVVERPSSVVKELVENSLDAGARTVQVWVDGGGRNRIKVVDDGQGIPPQQIELALTRHATSKLTGLSDLAAISSFGFRGEALPSIASVSRFRISSLAKGHRDGSSVEVEFGISRGSTPVAVPQGTQVEVCELFSNVPARLKFLKTQSTESKRCQEIVQRFGLAHPEVDFELFVGGRSALRFLKGQELLLRLGMIWPPALTEPLLPFAAHGEGMSVHGLAGAPAQAQLRADRILLYVNRRPVQDRILLKAVREGYSGRLLSREYPQAVVFLEIDPSSVDVNVHPAKSEVRFQEESSVFALIRSAIARVLGPAVHPSPSISRGQHVDSSTALPFKIAQRPREHGFNEESAHWELRDIDRSAPREPVPALHSRPEPRTSGQVSSLNGMEYLGQVATTYLLLRTEDGLLIVDQHAAHERVIFEKLKHGSGIGAPLALPLEIPLHPSHREPLQRSWNHLHELGFVLETGGPNLLLVRSVPGLLTSGQAKELLLSALSEKSATLEGLWTMLACRSAVKAGESLSQDEALSLLSLWLECPSRDHCPHGRPTLVAMTSKELEKLFKRGR